MFDEIATRIRMIMDKCGIGNIAVLSEICMVSMSAASRWFYGYNQPRVEEMARLCDHTGTTLDYLYRGKVMSQNDALFADASVKSVRLAD